MIESTDWPQWRKAKQCGTNACVEVARVGDQYLIRDTKHPEDGPLRFTVTEWTAFIDGVRDGDFDFG